MISQADIIKTLINKNCTDESVMNTALSTQYTPPKLLEKLTELERFDVALDVSMKLRLDVIPLLRTWAMRCLQNRNFQAARDKFRHCFLRLKRPGGGKSIAHRNLLSDITKELCKMTETQLSLAEEVELIKRGQIRNLNFQNVTQAGADLIFKEKNNSIIHKPKIYSECLFYLKEYGTFEDSLIFYINNNLWDEAVKVLIDDNIQGRINLTKFFIPQIFIRSASKGCLCYFIETLLRIDKELVLSQKYFKSIYDFCTRNKRYNLLYYIQNYIGDEISAAQIQIDFFLRHPCMSYCDLNQRLSNLQKALQNYKKYLKLISSETETKSENGRTEGVMLELGNPVKEGQSFKLSFSTMPKDEVENQIKLLILQIDITKNFAINEVSGCINDIDLNLIWEGTSSITTTTSSTKRDEHVESELESRTKQLTISIDGKAASNDFNDTTPVTLFDKSERRKTFLAALILIYYDLKCSTYFSKSGLDLANKIINDHRLDKVKVFKTAMRVMIGDETCDILENAGILLSRIKEDCQTSSIDEARSVCDEVIRDSIKSCDEADYKMELAKLLSPEAKIELYIELGKLNIAQRLACTMNRADYVENIIEEASKLNQNHVKTVCQLWLAKNDTRNSIR